MEYGNPQKLPDGRYFLKISGVTHQVNNVILQGELDPKSVSLKVTSDLFATVDAELLAQAKTSKAEWFKGGSKELSDESISSAYQESVTDGVLGATLATLRGTVMTVAFDSKKSPIDYKEIKNGDVVDVRLELSGLWFLKKSFGPIWRIVQLRRRDVQARVVTPSQYNFTEDPEEPEEEDDPADYLD